jgi:D-arabinose 1-dehydrogenase-like Zn-dependent alcohol dehydrogenase
MLDFCGAHDITADVEVIPIQKVNEAYERLLKSDVKYRFSTWPPSNLSNQERYVGFGSLEDI